ncbi:hypothetical protein AAF712_011403 [Marasmius tenuissimus]|uniref:Uncharacterized protein n=1 Tax=Marasmius tenuissimus TaxID=585030 RepID=A0ABR2ZKN5_9AGAR
MRPAAFVFFALSTLPFLSVLALPTGTESSITHIAHDEETDTIHLYRRDGLLVDTFPASKLEENIPGIPPIFSETDIKGRDLDNDYGDEEALGTRAADADNSAHGDDDFVDEYELDAFELERRQGAGSCSSVTIEELRQLPDFKKIEEHADKEFGTGKRNVIVNPKEARFPDRNAKACVVGDVAFKYEGDPKCQTQKSESSGQLVGTSGKVSIKTIQGFKSKASFTTTQSSRLAIDSRVSASAGFGKLAGVSAEFSVSSEFFNSNTKVTESDTNNQNEISIDMEAKAGKQCTISTTVKSCQIQAKGALNLKATGWVWFNYEDKKKGHFKWAVNMDNVLNDDQRTSPMEIAGDVRSETKDHGGLVI